MSEKIQNGWKWVKLREVVFINSKNLTPNYPYDEIYYLDTGSVAEGRLISSYKKFYLKEAPSRAKRIVNDGDIVYSLVRPIQRHYGIIKNPPDNLIVSTGFAVITADNNKADNRFTYYYLTLDEIVEYLDSIAEGSTTTYPSIVPDDLKNLIFPLPPLPEQKAIAEVLSSIDDKIELLHRQNKTLEEMAMTLFRQWFIEPTKDRLPEGWEEVRLGEFFPVITGKKDANFATDDGSYPFFTCSQKPLKAPNYSFDGNAILLAGNGDFNIKRYKGKFEAYQRTYVLIPYNSEYLNFLYLLMKFNLDEITGSFKGSVINYITKDMITDFKFSLPKDRSSIKDKLLYFDRIYDKVDVNTSQIQTLEKLRDTLLPKLMSGEVRVKV